jgi:hypothetical protein
VTDVQVAVGFRRETGVYPLTGAPAALGNVFFDKFVNKIAANFFCHDL